MSAAGPVPEVIPPSSVPVPVCTSGSCPSKWQYHALMAPPAASALQSGMAPCRKVASASCTTANAVSAGDVTIVAVTAPRAAASVAERLSCQHYLGCRGEEPRIPAVGTRGKKCVRWVLALWSAPAVRTRVRPASAEGGFGEAHSDIHLTVTQLSSCIKTLSQAYTSCPYGAV